MQPYNQCENHWLSRVRKHAKKHWTEWEPLYAVLAGIVGVSVFVLAVLTSISSFY